MSNSKEMRPGAEESVGTRIAKDIYAMYMAKEHSWQVNLSLKITEYEYTSVRKLWEIMRLLPEPFDTRHD